MMTTVGLSFTKGSIIYQIRTHHTALTDCNGKCVGFGRGVSGTERGDVRVTPLRYLE